MQKCYIDWNEVVYFLQLISVHSNMNFIRHLEIDIISGKMGHSFMNNDYSYCPFMGKFSCLYSQLCNLEHDRLFIWMLLHFPIFDRGSIWPNYFKCMTLSQYSFKKEQACVHRKRERENYSQFIMTQKQMNTVSLSHTEVFLFHVKESSKTPFYFCHLPRVMRTHKAKMLNNAKNVKSSQKPTESDVCNRVVRVTLSTY